MKNNTKSTIKPGDTVILGAQEGLGICPYLVLEVTRASRHWNLRVQGQNGQIWWARSTGARAV